MIDAAIRITVTPEKRKEMLQTFKAIIVPIRREQGCIRCNCYVDIETEDNILLINEWESSGDLNTHLRSVNFGILSGAIEMLNNKPDIRFNTITSSAGAEAIIAARG